MQTRRGALAPRFAFPPPGTAFAPAPRPPPACTLAWPLLPAGEGGVAMRKTHIVLAIGASAAAVGAFLSLWAGYLATRWQPLGGGGWGGTTDAALRQSYHTLGFIVLCFGLALVTAAAWNWMTGGHDTSGRPARQV